MSDYLDRVAVEYTAESGGDSGVNDEQSALAAEAGVVRTVLRGPQYEWKCETRRPVLVTIKLFWQEWTGLARRPTVLTHLVCLSGVPWDDNDDGHLMAGAATRQRNSNAPGEQMEQTLSVKLSPEPGAVEDDGITPGPSITKSSYDGCFAAVARCRRDVDACLCWCVYRRATAKTGRSQADITGEVCVAGHTVTPWGEFERQYGSFTVLHTHLRVVHMRFFVVCFGSGYASIHPVRAIRRSLLRVPRWLHAVKHVLGALPHFPARPPA